LLIHLTGVGRRAKNFQKNENVKKSLFPNLRFPEFVGELPPSPEYATFGRNTDGRFLMFQVRKASHSGKTVGYFEVVFFVEKTRNNSVLWDVYFRSALGQVYGNLKNDRSGVIDIYDIVLGDYLVNDDNGKVIKSLSLPESELWSPRHTTSNLINSGKTVGQIIGEHLETLEKNGKGGRAYSEQAAKWFFDQKREDESANRFIIKF